MGHAGDTIGEQEVMRTPEREQGEFLEPSYEGGTEESQGLTDFFAPLEAGFPSIPSDVSVSSIEDLPSPVREAIEEHRKHSSELDPLQ